MKRVALLFVLAVFLPSLVLAWLAVRSLRDQQFVLERQQTLLYQALADRLARDAETHLDARQLEFGAHVERLLAGSSPADLAPHFDDTLRQHWPLADVGFAVTLAGNLLSPAPTGRPDARSFHLANAAFFGNRQTVEVFANLGQSSPNLGQFNVRPTAPSANFLAAAQNAAAQDSQNVQAQRMVIPQQQLALPNADAPSRVTVAETGFRQLVGTANDGAFARFLDNQLKLMFWYRSPRDPQLVFGTQVQLPRLIADLRPLVRVAAPLHAEVCVALLNDTARPVALSHPGFQPAAWKRPFVATEIGEALPHWEMAVYLRDPGKLNQSARTLTFTLSLLVTVLVLAIGVGGWLLVADLRRQLTLARQQTDFVSNVSHELKTPLTSIRMFAELLAEGRVTDPAKQHTYLQVITAEAARLTRLINNVLDFARLERSEQKFAFTRCDLGAVVAETVAGYRPHLEQAGFTLELALPAAPVFVNGDRDALAQVLVNLLSNAEKYADDRKEIRVELCELERGRPRPQDRPRTGQAAADTGVRAPAQEIVSDLEVRVLDRGLGVPPGTEERIFAQFYRAHDALSSGIQGSGLGLTLARQIARAHGGEVSHAPRAGGGSCFVLRLPGAEGERSDGVMGIVQSSMTPPPHHSAVARPS